MAHQEVSNELKVRHMVNQMENLAYEALWANPDHYDRIQELICPVIQELDRLAQRIKGGMCPPGTIECSDGICRICCKRPRPRHTDGAGTQVL